MNAEDVEALTQEQLAGLLRDAGTLRDDSELTLGNDPGLDGPARELVSELRDYLGTWRRRVAAACPDLILRRGE
jgi:hypothetical protein